MVTITYQPADTEIIERMLAENGTYMVTVHNRHIVKCEKTVALMDVPQSAERDASRVRKSKSIIADAGETDTDGET